MARLSRVLTLVLMTMLRLSRLQAFFVPRTVSNISGNGVGYNNLADFEFQNRDSNLQSTSYYGGIFSFNDLINFANVISNIDFISLNDFILKLTKNIESMCDLACTVNPSNESSLSSHSLSPDTNTS